MSLLLNAHRMLEDCCKPRETACPLLIPTSDVILVVPTYSHLSNVLQALSSS